MGAPDFVSWAIAALVAAILAGFALHLFGLSRLPHSRRPAVPKHDRFGRDLGDDENEQPGLEPDGSAASKGRVATGRKRRRR